MLIRLVVIFNQIERIPSLNEMFGDSKLNLHLDIGCAAGEFLFDLESSNISLKEGILSI